MDISKLSQQQKSVMLAKAMDLTVYYEFRHDPYRKVTVIIVGPYHMDSDKYEGLFYDETAMHYARRVVQWALPSSEIGQRLTEWLDETVSKTDDNNFTRHAPRWWFVLSSPDDTEILDKALELALEIGLVPLPDAEEDRQSKDV